MSTLHEVQTRKRPGNVQEKAELRARGAFCFIDTCGGRSLRKTAHASDLRPRAQRCWRRQRLYARGRVSIRRR